MWSHQYTEETTLAPAQLWPVLADVAGWPAIDANIARLEVSGTPGSGTRFMLQPKGGPRLRFTIGDFEPPSRYSDICHLPFAAMTTVHALEPTAVGTRIRVRIEIAGPLAWLWGRVVGRKHADGLPAQTARFIAAAAARR